MRDWAESNKPIKHWAYAIAIDVLLAHKVNPLTIENPQFVAKFWAMQQQDKLTLEQAKNLFLTKFAIPDDQMKLILETITAVYHKI